MYFACALRKKKIIHGNQRCSNKLPTSEDRFKWSKTPHKEIAFSSSRLKKMGLLPLTIFHNGRIDDSHLFHEREPFTYGSPGSANLHQWGNAGSIRTLQVVKMNWTLHHRGQKLLLTTQDYYMILKNNIQETYFLFGDRQLQTRNARVLANKQQVNIYLMGRVFVQTSPLYMSGGFDWLLFSSLLTTIFIAINPQLMFK